MILFIMFTKAHHLVLVFLIVSQVHSTPEQESLRAKGVTILTDNDFESKTGIDYKNPNNPLPGDSDYVVLFFASYCGHCKHFIKQIYIDIMDMTAALDFKIIPAALQCPQNPKTANNFGVSGYPQIHYFQKSGGHFKYPRGARTKLTILKFIEDSHQGKQYVMGTESTLLNPKVEQPKPEQLKPEVKVEVQGEPKAKEQQKANIQSQTILRSTQGLEDKTHTLGAEAESKPLPVQASQHPIQQKKQSIIWLSYEFKIVVAVVVSIVFIVSMIGVYKASNNKHQDHTRLIHVSDRSSNNEAMYVMDPDKKDMETLEQEADENQKVQLVESLQEIK